MEKIDRCLMLKEVFVRRRDRPQTLSNVLVEDERSCLK
jgi:hypothetical protein